MKKNIAIVMGGYTSEFNISLKSASVVKKYLSSEKYNTYKITISKDSWSYETEDNNKIAINKNDFSLELNGNTIKFDCIFNAIHGAPGEDGTLQNYFDIIGLPYTSCNSYQAAITYNKRDCLSILKPYGVKTATSYYLNEGDPINSEAIINTVGLPCFVKANKAGSSYGVSKVNKVEELLPAIDIAFKEDNEIIIEAFLEGTEVSVGVITYNGETKVLPITEIVSENDFFDFEAKYLGKSEEITPARISQEIEEKVNNAALKIYKVLKMKGYSRSEFILKDNEPYLLEVNTTPGLTEESILPKQAAKAGISLSELFESAITEALKH